MAMTFDEDGGAWVADSAADLHDWEVLAVEDWKPGVKRYHCRRPDGGGYRFRMVYVKT